MVHPYSPVETPRAFILDIGKYQGVGVYTNVRTESLNTSIFYGLPPCFTSSRARSTIIMMSSQHVLLLTCTLPGHNYILEHAVKFSTTTTHYTKKHLLTIIYLNDVLISSKVMYKTYWPVQSSLRVTVHHHLIHTHD